MSLVTPLTCPRCQATDISDSKFLRLATLILSAGASLVVPLKLRKCKTCGHRF